MDVLADFLSSVPQIVRAEYGTPRVPHAAREAFLWFAIRGAWRCPRTSAAVTRWAGAPAARPRSGWTRAYHRSEATSPCAIPRRLGVRAAFGGCGPGPRAHRWTDLPGRSLDGHARTSP